MSLWKGIKSALSEKTARLKAALEETTTELRAQEHYDHARRLCAEGLTPVTAPEVIRELKLALVPGSSFEASAHRLLGQAYQEIGQPDKAEAEFLRAIHLLEDPDTRRANAPTIIQERNMAVDSYLAEIHLLLAEQHYKAQQYPQAIRHAKEAVGRDRMNLSGYYYWGASLLGFGAPKEEALDVFLKARTVDRAGLVPGWVEELLPEFSYLVPGSE